METETAKANEEFDQILEAIDATATMSDPVEEVAELMRILDMLNKKRAQRGARPYVVSAVITAYHQWYCLAS